MVVTGVLLPAERWRRLALAWSLASVASWILVLLVPVTFARPDLSRVDPLHAWVLGRVYGLDSAHVTFPCLHSAVTWICWHALRDRGPRLRAGLFVARGGDHPLDHDDPPAPGDRQRRRARDRVGVRADRPAGSRRRCGRRR